MSNGGASRDVELALVAPIKGSDSGAGAFLALCSDGAQYWVKAPNNPQGSRSLIPELVVSAIGTVIGAPVADHRIVRIPSELDWTYKPGYRLHGGLGSATRHVPHAIDSTDWQEYIARDHNRRRQAALAGLWDLCMGNDPQWLHQAMDDFSIVTFDHGFWFAGEVDWSPTSMGDRAWVYDIDMSVTSSSALRSTAHSVERLERDQLRAITRRTPLEWGTTPSELEQLADVIYLRAEGVARRLRAAAEHNPHP